MNKKRITISVCNLISKSEIKPGVERLGILTYLPSYKILENTDEVPALRQKGLKILKKFVINFAHCNNNGEKVKIF